MLHTYKTHIPQTVIYHTHIHHRPHTYQMHRCIETYTCFMHARYTHMRYTHQHTHTTDHCYTQHTHTHPSSPLSTDASSAAIAEAGDLCRMSHRPKVASTLKLLEGIEVSLLFSFELFNFLFLNQESQCHSSQRGDFQALEGLLHTRHVPPGHRYSYHATL